MREDIEFLGEVALKCRKFEDLVARLGGFGEDLELYGKIGDNKGRYGTLWEDRALCGRHSIEIWGNWGLYSKIRGFWGEIGEMW